MFGLFKKKKETPAPEPAAEAAETKADQSQEYKAFAAEFSAEETDILAVTGPGGFGGTPVGDSGLFRVTIGLTAWMDEYTHELQQGDAKLEAMVDETLLEYLYERIPRNFIITVTVRPSEDGKRFLMLDLPKPGFDEELKAILDEQKKPVILKTENLGDFTLNRSLGWFETTVDWLDRDVSLTIDQAEETRQAAIDTARTLLADKENWNERLRGYAADTLLDKANELLDEDEEPITRDELLAQMELDSILTGPDGAFEFWFGGDDLLLAHPIHVTGDLTQGPLSAEMEG